MSHLFQVDRVKLLCSCGMLKPITAVYFCRYCLKLRCGNCVSHEVDTLFCPNCLENMPSTEARLKKNRCANCFDCPSCGHTLLVRAASVQVPHAEDRSASFARKVYYLGCTSCRWTTRDVGLEDQTVATGGWNEKDHPNHNRIQDLFEYYRAIAQREKIDNERKRGSKRKTSYLSLTEKYSLSSSFSSIMSRKSLSSPFSMKDTSSSLDVEPAEATDDIPELPDDAFTEPVNLSSVTTIEQRISVPEWQPEETAHLFPLHKHLLVKRSHRCRQCEHNLSKPEYNPSSIKFKIQLGAFYHVPEIRLVKEAELKWGVTTTMQLSLCNPTPHDMTVALLPYVAEAYSLEAEDKQEPEYAKGPMSLAGTCARRVDLPRVRTRLEATAEVALPQGEVVLAAKDDTAEYDDADSSSNFKDDPHVVAWRRANKVGVNVEVTPAAGGSPAACFALVLRYEYTNTVTTASESRTVTLNIPVLINAGKVGE